MKADGAFSKEKYAQLEKENVIYWKRDSGKRWKPYVKYYLDGRVKRPSALWDDIDGNKKGFHGCKSFTG
ncbi:MAG: hypothetical protein LRY73_06625 [Bacillus sp. (in: Bacteria)]|nr:hypothetical protein [Bacillus sp. (in: firmicutes)]